MSTAPTSTSGETSYADALGDWSPSGYEGDGPEVVGDVAAVLGASLVGGLVGGALGYSAWKAHPVIGAIAGWWVGSFVSSRVVGALEIG